MSKVKPWSEANAEPSDMELREMASALAAVEDSGLLVPIAAYKFLRKVRARTRVATRHAVLEEVLMHACVHCFPRISKLGAPNAH